MPNVKGTLLKSLISKPVAEAKKKVRGNESKFDSQTLIFFFPLVKNARIPIQGMFGLSFFRTVYKTLQY